MELKERMGLIFIFGTGLASLALFIAGTLGMEFSQINTLLLSGFILVLVVNFVSLGSEKPVYVRPKRGRRAIDTLLILLIALLVCYAFFRALNKPVESYDAVSIYGLKSKILYLAGGVPENFFSMLASGFHGAHPDYPMLVPVSEACVYSLIGRFDDITVKVIFPLFYLSFLCVFYSCVKRITGKTTPALFFTFALASVKQFADYATLAVADLVLGIYFCIGAMYLYLWLRERKNIFLFTSSLAAVLCVWTKNEGTLLAVILVAAAFLGYLRMRREGALPRVFYLALSLGMVGLGLFAWELFKRQRGLENENFNVSMITLKGLLAGTKRIPAVLYEYQKQFFGFKKWNIAWIVAAWAFFANFRKAFTGDIKYITILFIMFAAGYGLMYMFSAVDIGFLARITGSRFLLHILPLAVFWVALLLHEAER